MSGAAERPGAPLPRGGLRVLTSTPLLLEGWLAELEPERLDQNEGPGTFSPRDVVAHLIQGEREDWMPRVERLLEHGDRVPFEPFDPHDLGPGRGGPIDTLLGEFSRLRGENLIRLLELGLGPGDASRRGLHPSLGSVTLGQLLATWVAHDLAHLGQVSRLLNRGLSARIGPWRALFSRLRDR